MQMNVVVVFWSCRNKSVAVVNVKPLQTLIVEPMCLENQRLALADLQCSCNGRAIVPCSGEMRCTARSLCRRQHAWVVTSSEVRTMVMRADVTNAPLVTSSEVRTIVTRVIMIWTSSRIMQSVANGQRDARMHAGRRPDEWQREAWSPKDLRTPQERAIAKRTSIR